MQNPSWTATFGSIKCAICGNSFTARQHNSKYCSYKCYTKSYRKEYKTVKKGKNMNAYEKSLKEMYELGYKHGYEVAIKDLEIIRLQKEVKELNK
jgi:imidazole glycerol phosphate synthase subunit HisF